MRYWKVEEGRVLGLGSLPSVLVHGALPACSAKHPQGSDSASLIIARVTEYRVHASMSTAGFFFAATNFPLINGAPRALSA